MAGFENDVLLCSNVNFNPALPKPHPGLINLNGQLIIGSTALNVGGTHLNIGTITSTTLAIGYSTPNITIEAGTTIPTTFVCDVGSATPALNQINILGLSGSKTAGSGNTIIIRSPPYTDISSSTSVILNSGTFATAAITLTTPVTAGLADGDLLEFVATNGVLVIQLAATQVAHLGTLATSVAGTITGTATGDSISLRYQASTNDWWTTSSIGNWILA